MTLNNSDASEAAHELTAFAADLADAAYTAVLQYGIKGSWIDLQLDVWRVLAASVMPSEQTASRSPPAAEFIAWREAFLSALTDTAYRTVLQYGLQGPFLEVELDLHLALREVIERSRSNTGLHFVFEARAQTIADALLARFGCQASPPAEIECCRA
jgi:hypothetical protein